MVTINQKSELFTVIIEFELDPKFQLALINGVVDVLKQYNVEGHPGFVSTSFHASEDGTRVINYAQYQTKEAWKNWINNDAKTKIDEVINNCGVTSQKVDSFQVEKVIES